MLRARVIPCLLLRKGGLVKTVRFSNAKYVGDPINAVKIFNEKEVDELILLDIDASRERREPDYERIRDIVSEAFMPVAYGGGVKTVEQAQRLISLGVEKVIVNSAALGGFEIVARISERLGSSSTVVAVDVSNDWRGRHRVYDATAGKSTDRDLLEHVRQAERHGAGEIFINDVERDGTGTGYDIGLLKNVCSSVQIPVIACGGAGSLGHLREAVAAGVSGAAAGSLFIFVGRHRAVMINYPEYGALRELFGNG